MNGDDVLVLSNILNTDIAQMFIKMLVSKRLVIGSNSNYKIAGLFKNTYLAISITNYIGNTYLKICKKYFHLGLLKTLIYSLDLTLILNIL
jgi:hypothetical protein